MPTGITEIEDSLITALLRRDERAGSPSERTRLSAHLTILAPERIRAIPFREHPESKFMAMAGRCFGDEHVGRVREAVLGLDGLGDVGNLGALLSAAASR